MYISSWNLDLISEVRSFLTNFMRFVKERYLMDFNSFKTPLSSELDFIMILMVLIGFTYTCAQFLDFSGSYPNKISIKY